MARGNDASDISNPFSTGGGGHAFETCVAASYLAALLAGHTPRGQLGTTVGVQLQARYQWALVDDISVVTDVGGGECRRINVQAKSTIHFRARDRDFHDVLLAVWTQYARDRADGTAPQQRLAVAFACHPARLDDLRRLLGQADAASDAHDFAYRLSLPQFTSDAQRDLLELFHEKLSDISGAPTDGSTLWEFLRVFSALHFDFGDDGTGSDALCSRALLRWVLASGEDADAGRLFSHLKEIAVDGAPKASSFTRDELRERAMAVGFALRDREDYAADFRALRKHREDLTSLISDRLYGDVHVSRSGLEKCVLAAVQTNPLTALIGEPGAGKSALLRHLLGRLTREGEVIFLDAHDMGDSPMAPRALQHNWLDVLRAASSSGRWLIIDRLEALQGDEPRQRFVTTLLNHVQATNAEMEAHVAGHEPMWRVVLACREHPWAWLVPSLPPLQNAFAGDRVAVVRVGGFSDCELAQVEAECPRLHPALADTRLRELLRRPFLLDTFLRCEAEPDLPPSPTLVTETWLMDRVWHGVVRLSEGAGVGRGTPAARQLTLIDLAVHSVAGSSDGSPEMKHDQEALRGLQDIGLVRVKNSKARIAHDAFVDWALARYLLIERDRVGDRLLELGESYRLDRSLRLLALSFLEVNRDVGEWMRLVADVRSDGRLSPRWGRLVVAAPLYSAVLGQLVPSLLPVWLDPESDLLRETLLALQNELREPDPDMQSALTGLPEDARAALLDYSPRPVRAAWVPVLSALVERVDAIPGDAMQEFVNALRFWMTEAPSAWPLREEVTRLALSLYSRHAFTWRGREDEP